VKPSCSRRLQHIGEMSVPWGDHQEQQWSGVNQSLECYRGQSWRSDPSCFEKPSCSCVDPRHWNKKLQSLSYLRGPKMLEMPELWDICRRKLLIGSGSVPRERVSVSKAERRWTSDMEMQSLEFVSCFFGFAFVQDFLTMPFGMVMCNLWCWRYMTCFFILIL